MMLSALPCLETDMMPMDMVVVHGIEIIHEYVKDNWDEPASLSDSHSYSNAFVDLASQLAPMHSVSILLTSPSSEDLL